MPSQVRHRAEAILESNGLRPTRKNEDLVLRFASAAVVVGFFRVGAQVVITLRSPVLSDISLGHVATEEVLLEVNKRNCDTHFGKWVFYEDVRVIAVEYDLLGDHLQEEELLTAIAAIARLADSGDDALQQQLGTGRRAADTDVL